MEKVYFRNKRKNQFNQNKESLSSNRSMTNIKNRKSKDEFSLPLLEIIYKYLDNLKSLIKKNISQESNSLIFKQMNSILIKMTEQMNELNSQVIQHQNLLMYYESKIRNLQKTLFEELLNKDILQNNVNSLSQKEKDYELIKEKTGIIVSNGKIINTNRKDNEIIILRTENSTLKGVIDQYEKKLLQKEKEYKKNNLNLIKEKNDLIIKINNLNNQIKNCQNSNYSRYSIAKKKLNISTNKRIIDYSGVLTNRSNDFVMNNIPSTINVLKTNDNNYNIDQSNIIKLSDKKMKTIASTHLHARTRIINHSHKNSHCQYTKKFIDDNDKIIKDNENNIMNHTINKKFHQNMEIKLNKKRNTNKILNENVYNKIIIKENYNSKNDSKKVIKTDRTKTKSHEHHLSNCVDDKISLKKNKNLNTYFISNKPIKRIFHKKTSSIKIKNIPFNNNVIINQNADTKEGKNNNSNKENNRNDSNLVNIKNLILTKAQKNKKNKINLIYRNFISNNISNYNSINNSRNLNLKNNMSKLHTFNNSKVPTPTSFANN